MTERRLAPAALACLLAVTGCGDGTPTGPSTAAVVVTSPIGDVMAAGRSVQLSAAAEDARGDPVGGGTFVWESSDPEVATVSGGRVNGIAAGTATISARRDGATGSITIQVVEADLETIATLLEDEYSQLLISSLDPGTRDALADEFDACSMGLADGNILALDDCLRQIPQTTPTNGTDRALLAVLGVIAERALLLLNL